MTQAHKRSDAVKNRALIMETAARMFKEDQNISMKKIATACEIGTGTLYRHFSNIAELAMAIIDDEVELLFEEIEHWKKEGISGAALMRLMLLHFVELKERNIALLEEIEAAGKRGRVMMEVPFYSRLQQEIILCMQTLGQEKSAEFYADVLLNAFSTDIYNYHRQRGMSKEDYVDQILELFIEKARH